MKFFKYLLTTLIILGGIGYGIYYFGTNIASDKLMDEVYGELEDSGQLEEIQQLFKNDPEVKKFIEAGANADESKLPFKTKEQAARVLIQKIGISELESIQSKYQNGVSNKEVMEILSEVEGKLTDEEFLSLKVIAYKELNK